MGVCRGQLGDVLQVVRVEGEAGDAERGGGQLENDDGLAVLRRTQVNTSVVTNIRIRIRIRIFFSESRIFGFGFVIFARRIIFGFGFVIES